MVSLMPQIPLPSTSNAVATPIYERKRRYTPAEPATFKFNPASLTLPEIRSESKYYKNNNDYRGPRTVPNKSDGIRLLELARSVVLLPLDQRAQAAPVNVVGTNTSRQILPEGEQLLYDVRGRCHVYLIWMQTYRQTRAAQRPDLVAPWTEWDDNNPKGEALPNITPEDKARVFKINKKSIFLLMAVEEGDWKVGGG